MPKKLAARGAKIIVSARKKPHDNFPHTFIPLDVTNRKELTRLAKKMNGVDGVIYSSGILAPSLVSDIDEQHLSDLIATNILPPTIITAHMARDLEKRRGFLVFMGSVAGEYGLPLSQPYAGGKNYLRNFAESVAVEHPHMQTHLIAPGFVKTDMTSGNRFVMPFMLSAEKAADIILFGIALNKFYIAFPWPTHLMMNSTSLLPAIIRRWVWRHFGHLFIKK